MPLCVVEVCSFSANAASICPTEVQAVLLIRCITEVVDYKVFGIAVVYAQYFPRESDCSFIA
jgi:hypothetical protein